MSYGPKYKTEMWLSATFRKKKVILFTTKQWINIL